MSQEGRVNTYTTTTPSANELNKYNPLESAQNLDNSHRCRICLDQTGQLTQLPCSCIGEIGVVHESCFSQWVTALRNGRSGPRSEMNNIYQVENDIYEMPCQLCRTRIKMQMKEETKCFTCKDLLTVDRCIIIFCLFFFMVVTTAVVILCVTNLINSKNETARKVIFIIVMLIFIIAFVCLAKTQISRLMVKVVKQLKIIPKQSQAIYEGERKVAQVEICDFLNQNKFEELYTPHNRDNGKEGQEQK